MCASRIRVLRPRIRSPPSTSTRRTSRSSSSRCRRLRLRQPEQRHQAVRRRPAVGRSTSSIELPCWTTRFPSRTPTGRSPCRRSGTPPDETTFLEQDRGLGRPGPTAAVLLQDHDADPTGIGEHVPQGPREAEHRLALSARARRGNRHRSERTPSIGARSGIKSLDMMEVWIANKSGSTPSTRPRTLGSTPSCSVRASRRSTPLERNRCRT